MLSQFFKFLYGIVVPTILALNDVQRQLLDCPYGELCPTEDYCSSTNRSFPFKVEEFPFNVRKSFFVNCMCDTDCVTYGDCCLDSDYFDTENQRQGVSRYGCTSQFYTKNTCPPTWYDDLIRRNCEKAFSDGSNLTACTPVTSTRTNITYLNKYCAVCNENSLESQLIYWDMETDCEEFDLPEESVDYDLINGVPVMYNESTKQWQKKFLNEIKNCRVKIAESKDLFIHRTSATYGNLTEEYVSLEESQFSNFLVRPCIENAIRTCPPSFRDNKIKNLCKAYTFVVYEKRGDNFHRPYRNVHCAICNGVPETELKYEPHSIFILLKTSYIKQFERLKTIVGVGQKNNCRDRESNCTAPELSIFEPHFNILKNPACLPPKPCWEKSRGYGICKCSNDFAELGDCRLDAENFAAENHSRVAHEFNCIDFERSMIVQSSGLEERLSLTRIDCDYQYNGKDRELREKCFSAVLESVDLLGQIPIQNNETGVMYANIHCARCNNKETELKNLEYGDLEIFCVFRGKTWMFRCLKNNYIHCERTLEFLSKIQSWQTSRKLQCKWTPLMKNHNLSFYHNNKDVFGINLFQMKRLCIIEYVDLIRTCPETWKNDSVKQLCESYESKVDLVQTGQIRTYKNVYCGLCNGVLETSLECPIIIDLDLMSKFYELFTINEIQESYDSNNSTNLDRSQKSNFQEFSTIVGFSISILFLSSHLIVFGFLKELHNLPGTILASLCLSLIGAYASFLIGALVEGKKVICITTAIITHYFFVAVFVWMFIMAFDMWSMLRLSTRGFKVPNKKQGFKLVIYSICGWILPALVAGLAIFVNSPLIGSDEDGNFDSNVCWFRKNSARLIFFVLPLCLVLIGNILFFTSSAYMIYRSTSMTRKFINVSNTIRDFKLCVRLAVVMGMTWITGILAYVCKSELLWLVSTLLNTMLGLFIFLSFTYQNLQKIFLKFRK